MVGNRDGVALDNDIKSRVPVIASGRQRDVRVAPQVNGLLLVVAGTEVQRLPDPDRDQRGDVRPSVRA